MKPGNKNSYNSLKSININNSEYKYYSLSEAEKNGLDGISKLPKSLKVLLENLLRYEDDLSVTKNQIEAIKEWLKTKKSTTEIAYRPARVLLQDYTGIPAVADLAAMREAVKEKNKEPNTINPLSAVDLVIDHSVQVDKSANANSFEKNVDIEFKRNGERYSFLKWGQQAFNNFRIVPPGTGICHQVNLEYLSKVVWSEEFQGDKYLFPDTLVGTDSHTTMVNGLSVLGWGVGGIEAEAGMLGQPISMLIPEVIGFEVKNKMPEGTTATDLVLTVVKMLRDKGVVGKFVEFYGEGLKNLTLADRATIANMAPEYGATCGFFPIDNETLKYLKFSGRDQHTVEVVEQYAKEQGLWASDEIEFTDIISLDMSTVVPTISGPKRPQDKVLLTDASTSFKKVLEDATNKKDHSVSKVSNTEYEIKDGSILIAAITSCTNTSNPNVDFLAAIAVEPTPQLTVLSADTRDTINGQNGNTILEPGETIELLPLVKNYWGPTDDVRVGIAFAEFEDQTKATIVQDEIEIGSISAYATLQDLEESLKITIAGDVGNNVDIRFNLTVWSGPNQEYMSEPTEIVINVKNSILLSGVISDDYTFLGNKEYLIVNNVAFSGNAIVTMEPGTIIKFSDGKGMNFLDNASLICDGTPENRVTLINENAQWAGLSLGGDGNKSISFANISGIYAQKIFKTGTKNLQVADVLISDSRVYYVFGSSTNTTFTKINYDESFKQILPSELLH